MTTKLAPFAGITTVFSEKKWVFSYIILGLIFWKFQEAAIVQILVILIPSVYALAGVSKYINKDKS